MTKPHRRSRTERIEVNGLGYRVRRWGEPSRPPLLLLHGARDCSETFQFMIDAFQQDWSITAPDWRGHGHSDWAPRRYWTHDFLSDLDVLVETMFPGRAIALLGHSLGGNIGGLYSGLRPGRVRRFVSLDGLGPVPDRLPVDGAEQLTDYLRHWPHAHAKSFATLSEVAGRLSKANPRLTPARAAFMAEASTCQGEDGRWRWLFDPGLTVSFLTLKTLDEWASIWRRTEAPVLWVASGDPTSGAAHFDDQVVAERRRLVPHAAFERLTGTGHNLHHDRPDEVARLVESFLLA